MLLADIRHSKKPKDNVALWHYVEVLPYTRIYHKYVNKDVYFTILEHLEVTEHAEVMYNDNPEYPYIWKAMHSHIIKHGEGIIKDDGVFEFTYKQQYPDLVELQRLILIIKTMEERMKNN